MKKRKVLAVLLSLVLILSAFGGCTQSKLRAYSVYLQNDEIWTKYKSTYTPPREASVTFNGVTYTGTYSTPTFDYNDYYYELYSYEGAGVSFQVDANGRLRKLNLDHQENKTCTFDEACWQKAADEVADNYISLDNHRVEYVVTEDPHMHQYRYERDLGSGYSKIDVIIGMNCSGEICYFRHEIEFENIRSVVVDQDKVQKAIDGYMKKTYGKSFSRWDVEGKILVKTRSNQCAVFCRVWPYLFDESKSPTFGLGLIVIVDHQKYNPFKP
ncbi:MAG: hypothetical protein IJO04_03365 [Oscillospiraceae bacterium]|nr:hypothetical protein [Oscillospiraceae bacterium]